MLLQILLLSSAFLISWNGISAALAQSAAGTSSSVVSTTTTPTGISTGTASFPAVGSIPRDYTPEGLEQLWDVIGPVEPPPFTTTRVPSAAVTLPPSPPPLYPSFYAPAPKDILPDLKYPKGFKFGVDTSAYQVEGATKNEGKGPTMWDWAPRQPGGTIDNTTVFRGLGIYPFGAADSPVNTAGIDHYSDVIDYHLAHNVEPVISLFHWDTPVALQVYYGGFTVASDSGRLSISSYAKTVFKAYNGRVKTWFTFNEPGNFCSQISSYPFDVTLATGVNSSTAPYHCAYNLLKAHAGAVKAFREMNISGEIGFKNSDYIGTPWRSNSTEDALAVERHAAFQIGLFSNPVYTTGDWPDIVKDTLPAEYLPRFTEQEKKDLLSSADSFAITSYRSLWVKAPDEGIDACVANSSHSLWPVCNQPVYFDSDYGWPAGPAFDPVATSSQATPLAIRSLLKDLHSRWPSSKLYVSEFGTFEPFAYANADISQIKEDVGRTNYLLTYLGQMLLSVHEDGVPIQGAFAWGMMDDSEWVGGTSVRYGIQHVDYTTLERTYKRSALSLAEFFGSHLQG
ncbi:glycoside hydrolase superfamily [Armillaria mellea]|nr:glycoside hydrolase superfamily [Armillaria mellea]